jgi:DnaJ-class molecular chaperone
MAKKFASLNYYEMLDLSSGAAFTEIRHAYNAALQVYQTDSLISYSFFSQDERKEILSLLEKAYLTLINEKERQDYDNELIRLGVINQTTKRMTGKMPVGIFDINRKQSKAGAIKNASAELRAKVTENKVIGEIISRQEISGADLKKIRNELAVPLEHIAQETKIRIDHLRSIEESKVDALPAIVFLKGFIKSYLKCLGLEPVDEICMRYMNCLALPERKG